MKRLLLLSALPMIGVIALGIALHTPWWLIVPVALAVDLATDLIIVHRLKKQPKTYYKALCNAEIDGEDE